MYILRWGSTITRVCGVADGPSGSTRQPARLMVLHLQQHAAWQASCIGGGEVTLGVMTMLGGGGACDFGCVRMSVGLAVVPLRFPVVTAACGAPQALGRVGSTAHMRQRSPFQGITSCHWVLDLPACQADRSFAALGSSAASWQFRRTALSVHVV